MKTKTILVIDDTPDLQRSIIQFLNMEGYETVGAANGQEALDTLAHTIPDLVITDLLMPVMDGYSFIEHIKADAQLRDIPVVVFSAKPDDDSQDKALALGAVRFIRKPGSIDQILDTVNEIIQP
ncbi:response regulator [Parachryseolinea silvisoli]|jgi:CheY-like chemotaxis protein|uniref:response regulator n=1 Tax=Parachryseolinea silvisoli TaxID=2873601 RepID=UPI002265D68B|nr:response regulator [Parachryseolinea silvisoli]MCD9018198.1 response regulator [Parachryseolinea silvisoli]